MGMKLILANLLNLARLRCQFPMAVFMEQFPVQKNRLPSNRSSARTQTAAAAPLPVRRSFAHKGIICRFESCRVGVGYNPLSATPNNAAIKQNALTRSSARARRPAPAARLKVSQWQPEAARELSLEPPCNEITAHN